MAKEGFLRLLNEIFLCSDDSTTKKEIAMAICNEFIHKQGDDLKYLLEIGTLNELEIALQSHFVNLAKSLSNTYPSPLPCLKKPKSAQQNRSDKNNKIDFGNQLTSPSHRSVITFDSASLSAVLAKQTDRGRTEKLLIKPESERKSHNNLYSNQPTLPMTVEKTHRRHSSEDNTRSFSEITISQDHNNAVTPPQESFDYVNDEPQRLDKTVERILNETTRTTPHAHNILKNLTVPQTSFRTYGNEVEIGCSNEMKNSKSFERLIDNTEGL